MSSSALGVLRRWAHPLGLLHPAYGILALGSSGVLAGPGTTAQPHHRDDSRRQLDAGGPRRVHRRVCRAHRHAATTLAGSPHYPTLGRGTSGGASC
jgi:hypothetical protein